VARAVLSPRPSWRSCTEPSLRGHRDGDHYPFGPSERALGRSDQSVAQVRRTTREEWWAGTGLNRRHQDLLTFVRCQPTALPKSFRSLARTCLWAGETNLKSRTLGRSTGALPRSSPPDTSLARQPCVTPLSSARPQLFQYARGWDPLRWFEVVSRRPIGTRRNQVLRYPE
jgi:hypothetical protein